MKIRNKNIQNDGGINIIEKPVVNPVVTLREEFDDWAVLYNPDNGEVYGLNPIGVSLWKLIDGKTSVDDLISYVGKHYEHVPDTSKDHIDKFLTDLEKHGLIGVKV